MAIIARNYVQRSIALGFALLLSGCGGGGGGGGSGDSSSIPLQAPAPASPAYSGVTTPANLTDQSVGPLADAIWNATDLALLMVDDVVAAPSIPDTTVNETSYGSISGSVMVRGRTFPDLTQFLIIDFDEFDNGDGLVNGRIVVEKLREWTPDLPRMDRISYFDASVKIGDDETVISGHITRTLAGLDGVGSETLRGDIGVHFEPQGVSMKATNFNAVFGGSIPKLYIAEGRVFDSRYGYVDLETVSPWYVDIWNTDSVLPVAGGSLTARGLDNRELRLALIAPEVFALDYMPDGSATFSRSTRVSRSEVIEKNGFEYAISPEPKGLPVADAGASITLEPDNTVFLDGRYTSQPESAYLNFEWDLAFKPLGSEASLSATNATTPQLVLDKEGGYLLRLTVSDGTFVDEDYAILTADQDASPSVISPAAAQLLPDQLLVNQDTHDIPLNLGAPLTETTPNQSLNVTAGEDGIVNHYLTYPSPSIARLDVRQPGIYTLELGDGLDVQRLAVDVPLVFTSQMANIAEFEYRDANKATAAGDLNRDGHMDLVVSGTTLTNVPYATNVVTILLSDGTNSFQTPVRLTGGNGGNIAVADLNNDNLPDIVTGGSSVPGMMDIFLQQDSGSFALYQLNRLCWEGEPSIHVADINADNLADIVTQSGCTGGLVTYFLQQPDGVPGDAVDIPMEVHSSIALAIGDLNGDGVKDVVAGASDTINPPVALMLGQQGGQLSSPQFIPAFTLPSSSEPVVAVADINGDHRDDLVVAIEPKEPYNQLPPTIYVLLQTPERQLEISQSITLNGRVGQLYLEDFDSDGNQDIGASWGLGLHILYQKPNGGFTNPVFEGIPPHLITDLDGDGYNDLVRAGYSPASAVSVRFGQQPQLP